MLIDAAGNEVASDRCTCGRHKYASKPKCCVFCYGQSNLSRTGHSAECTMIQDHFPDSHVGVSFSEVEALPVAEFVRKNRSADTGALR